VKDMKKRFNALHGTVLLLVIRAIYDFVRSDIIGMVTSIVTAIITLILINIAIKNEKIANNGEE